MGKNNQLVIKVYVSGSTEAANTGLELAENITLLQNYPGGLSTGMTFFVPRDITANWSVQVGMRIAAYNGLNMVWEGYILGITPSADMQRMGVNVICEGAWSRFLQRRRINKPWADTRITDDVWKNATGAYDANDQSLKQIVTVDRNSRMRFTPKNVAFTINWYHRVLYIAPTGQTVKRVTWNYDLQEGAQQWALVLLSGAGTVLDTVSASGTGSKNITLGTPHQIVFFEFRADAGQTPPSDGTIYGEVSSVVVYTETGSINAQTITTQIASLAGLSTDVSKIGAETVSLVPFITTGFETYADLLSRAASYGDASFNKWAPWVDFSQYTSDSLPRLVLEQQPDLSAYDYAIRLNETNVEQQLSFTQDLDAIRNWIIVQYLDANNRQVYVSPNDDATLKDTNSITAYGERHEVINLNTTDITGAKNYAKRFLAARKDPQWIAVGQISVNGYIRGASNNPIPTSQIQPGKRIKIENWLNDLSGTGLTFLITGTTYTDADEKCALEIGLPNTLEVLLLRLSQK